MNDTQISFNTLGISDELTKALHKLNILTPTPIQEKSIPLLLENKDILASAQTGTGKTIAYVLPILQGLKVSQTETALILVPTRELATQVKDSILNIIGRESGIFTAVLIGGEPMPRQFSQLKRRPRIIVATPGRLNDHLQRGSVKLNTTRYLVLDETDRMLDMGFAEQLETVIQHLPKSRQTMMFSATMPANMMKLASNYLNDPQRIAVGIENQAAAKIKQDIIRTSQNEKLPLLLKELDQREGSVIIFVKTKVGAEKLTDQLRNENHSVATIHGDLKQTHRTRVIQAFRNRKSRIMVATDVAARGLDVPHIQHVINYDLPQCPEDYIHRIGRTGRAGAEGNALCFVAPNETGKWNAIHRLMHPDRKNPTKEDSFPRHQERRRKRFDTSSSGSKDSFKGKQRFGKTRFASDDTNQGRNFEKQKINTFDKPKLKTAAGIKPNRPSFQDSVKGGLKKLFSKPFNTKKRG